MREENEGGGGDATRLARRVRNRKGRARAHGVTELMTGGGRRPCTRRNKALTARCGRSSWRSWSEFGADQKRESTRAQRTQDGLGTLPSSSSIRRREGSLERGKLTQRSGQLVRPSPRSKAIPVLGPGPTLCFLSFCSPPPLSEFHCQSQRIRSQTNPARCDPRPHPTNPRELSIQSVRGVPFRHWYFDPRFSGSGPATRLPDS